MAGHSGPTRRGHLGGRGFSDYARDHNLDPSSDEANYGFLKHELETTHRGAIHRLKDADGQENKMRAFESGFEGALVKAFPSRRRFMDRAIRAYDREPPPGRLQGPYGSNDRRPEVTAGASDDANYFPDGRPRAVKPESMRDDPRVPGVTMEEARRHREAQNGDGARAADGVGFSAAYRARQAKADAEHEGMQLKGPGRSALAGVVRSGGVGATQNADRSLLDVRIHNPGPNTRASVETKGLAFREIKQLRGRQMQGAGEDV